VLWGCTPGVKWHLHVEHPRVQPWSSKTLSSLACISNAAAYCNCCEFEVDTAYNELIAIVTQCNKYSTHRTPAVTW
jgi:hypothetical protein